MGERKKIEAEIEDRNLEKGKLDLNTKWEINNIYFYFWCAFVDMKTCD